MTTNHRMFCHLFCFSFLAFFFFHFLVIFPSHRVDAASLCVRVLALLCPAGGGAAGKVYAQNGDFWHDWPIAIPMDYNSDNFTVPLTTLSTWVMFVLMFGCSLRWVRHSGGRGHDSPRVTCSPFAILDVIFTVVSQPPRTTVLFWEQLSPADILRRWFNSGTMNRRAVVSAI